MGDPRAFPSPNNSGRLTERSIGAIVTCHENVVRSFYLRAASSYYRICRKGGQGVDVANYHAICALGWLVGVSILAIMNFFFLPPKLVFVSIFIGCGFVSSFVFRGVDLREISPGHWEFCVMLCAPIAMSIASFLFPW